MPAIPLHIISGFLGSGKTTFLKQVLHSLPASLTAGVIQNEFASVSTDGYEIRNSFKGIHLLEINNGSVFCVCLLGGFVDSLRRFIDEIQPGIVFLEASGLSDTTSVAEILSHPGLTGKLFLAGNWCIVDVQNFGKTGKMVQRVIHQVRMADYILLNKADLAPDQIPLVGKEVSLINPFAKVTVTSWCQVPFHPEPVRGLHAGAALPEPLSRPEISSMVIRTTAPVPDGALRKFLDHWAPLAYRIKGFVLTGTHSRVAVQCTPGQTEIKPVDFWPGPTELIALTDRFTLHEWNRAFRECRDKGRS